MVVENRNGYGFVYSDGSEAYANSGLIFPRDAEAVIDASFEHGDCRVEAGPGTGKTHLVRDIQLLLAEDSVPVLTMAAHINGGSKRGAENALYVLDAMFDRHGADAALIIDNIDYYGYFRSKGNRYQVAKHHLPVAQYLIDWLNDSQTPPLIATSHNESWRQGHWNRRPVAEDVVTPTARALLESFHNVYDFSGEIDVDVAEELLSKRYPFVPEERRKEAVESLLGVTGELLFFRHIGHISVRALTEGTESLQTEIEAIDRETRALSRKEG